MKALTVIFCHIVLWSVFSNSLSGQLYVQDFELDSTASWRVDASLNTDFWADFFFDYSTVGIPPAPHGTGTRGLQLQANLFTNEFGGMSVSPIGQSFSGDYRLTFDWWANFNGPFPDGGSGSTNLSTFGVGTVGNFAQWPGGFTDCIWFAATGDGNSAYDWRAYSTAEPSGYRPGFSPYHVYAAGNNYGDTNNTHPYYLSFGGVGAPTAQFALFPQQSGTTPVGSSGMQWHEVEIKKAGTMATWKVDGLLIATIDLNTVTLSGSNIFFGHSDVNSGSSTDPNDYLLLFTLIDNINVSPLTMDVVPESLLVTRGTYVSGGVFDLAESDNVDLSVTRASSDIQSRTEFTVQAVSPVAFPSSLEITLEGSVFARSQVNQTIELLTIDGSGHQEWEQIDTRPATQFTDSTVTIVLNPATNLSRFIVDPLTMRMEARVRYQSVNPRQQFSSNTDQFIWAIGQ